MEIIYKQLSNAYCNMFRFALKMDSSQLSTWSVRTSGRREEFIPINKQLLRSYVDCCSTFGLVLARPSPNKLICLLTVFFIRCEVETKYKFSVVIYFLFCVVLGWSVEGVRRGSPWTGP